MFLIFYILSCSDSSKPKSSSIDRQPSNLKEEADNILGIDKEFGLSRAIKEPESNITADMINNKETNLLKEALEKEDPLANMKGQYFSPFYFAIAQKEFLAANIMLDKIKVHLVKNKLNDPIIMVIDLMSKEKDREEYISILKRLIKAYSDLCFIDPISGEYVTHLQWALLDKKIDDEEIISFIGSASSSTAFEKLFKNLSTQEELPTYSSACRAKIRSLLRDASEQYLKGGLELRLAKEMMTLYTVSKGSISLLESFDHKPIIFFAILSLDEELLSEFTLKHKEFKKPISESEKNTLGAILRELNNVVLPSFNEEYKELLINMMNRASEELSEAEDNFLLMHSIGAVNISFYNIMIEGKDPSPAHEESVKNRFKELYERVKNKKSLAKKAKKRVGKVISGILSIIPRKNSTEELENINSTVIDHLNQAAINNDEEAKKLAYKVIDYYMQANGYKASSLNRKAKEKVKKELETIKAFIYSEEAF